MTLETDGLCGRRDGFAVTATLRVEAGDTIALVGPNGSGKSTLVWLLAGLERAASGRAALDGVVLDDVGMGMHVAPHERPVGVMFQDLLLFPNLTCLENVAFPLRARGMPARRARERAAELLQRLGIPDKASARPVSLSGGEAQRVALARALVHGPRLLLLDEPLSALDLPARVGTRELLRRELDSFEGVRIVVTHDPVEAMVLADRIVVLEAGRVTQTGTPDQIRAAPRTPYVAELVGTNLFRGTLRRIDAGAVAISTAEGDIVAAVPTAWMPSEDVLAIVRASDVAVHATPPTGSARNVLRGPISSIWVEGERARIRVASAPPVLADVTLASVGRLGLRPGADVWVSFKAVEVELVEG
jgi:molybdate transport system ATP-binding protein